MIYSCFNEKAGHYEYFRDDRSAPINGDLPVPQLADRQAGKVGVPARDAGRPLPKDARKFGVGWQARGMIVSCKPSAVRGIGQTDALDRLKWLGRTLMVGSGAAIGVLYEHQRGGNELTGMFYGALVGASVAYFSEQF